MRTLTLTALCVLTLGCGDGNEPATDEPNDDGLYELCDDTCVFDNDGNCDDGGDGSSFSICDLGSDCGDCGIRETEDPPLPPGECDTEGEFDCTSTASEPFILQECIGGMWSQTICESGCGSSGTEGSCIEL